MKNHAWMLILVGCGTELAEDPGVGEPPSRSATAAPLPEGLEAVDGPLFRMDVRQPVFRSPVTGNAGLKMEGVLEDDWGRRSLTLKGPSGRTQVAPAGWNLPPAAAQGDDGTLTVCWNQLTGAADAHSGDIPNPANGLALWCRVGAPDGLGPAERLAAEAHAPWVQKVIALPGGAFRVVWYEDDGWFLARPEPHHVIREAIFDGGWGEPSVVDWPYDPADAPVTW